VCVCVCVCVYYSASATVKESVSLSCDELVGLTRRQRSVLCRRHTASVVDVVRQAAAHVASQCQRLMRYERWNCPLFDVDGGKALNHLANAGRMCDYVLKSNVYKSFIQQ